MSKFIPTKKSILWNYEEKVTDLQINVIHIKQQGRDCVPCTLAMLTQSEPQKFYKINNCNPVEWSSVLKEYNMKLAFCYAQSCYLDKYIYELLKGTYIICVYTGDSEKVLEGDATSHTFLLNDGKIYDSNSNKPSIDIQTDMIYRFYQVKSIFRVVPVDYPHQI